MNAELLMSDGHNGVGTSDFVCGEGNRLLASDDNGFVLTGGQTPCEANHTTTPVYTNQNP